MQDSHAAVPSYEERQKRREREQMLKAANKHPLNRRAAELLGWAGTTPSWYWIRALALMFRRLYPPPDYWPVVAPDLEDMRWGSNNAPLNEGYLTKLQIGVRFLNPLPVQDSDVSNLR